MRRAALLVVLAACKSGGGAAGPAAPVGPSPTEVAPLTPGAATAVVVLHPHVPTPVLDGPFLVTTINPGSSMDLALAPNHHCDDPKIVWFGYSGGGVAAGTGQTLCARSDAGVPRTNGFSGYDPSPPAAR